MNGYGPKLASLLGLSFLLFIGAMTAVNFLTPDKSFSESENRVLEPQPSFSMRSLLSGQFTSDFESYTSDQFAFRDTWVSVKTTAERALGKKDSNGVFLGKDGYLIEQYTSPSDIDLENRADAVQAFDQATPGLQTYVMLAPTAASILSNKLPAYAPVGDELADMERFHQLLPEDISFIDAYSALYARQEQQIFYKTDHHWTTEGAYYAYRELCKQMGITPQNKNEFNINQATDQFYGSLYSKSGVRRIQPDSIHLYLSKKDRKTKVLYVDENRSTDSIYKLDNLNKKDKYTVFLDGNHAHIRITMDTDIPSDKKLLVVKDSYANSLIPFLTDHFAEIDVIDLRYYDEPLLKLIQERQYENMLILYNVNTFFQDDSILNLTEGIQ